MTTTKTVFTSNGTKIEMDEAAQIITVTFPDGRPVLEAGYFDRVILADGTKKTASLYALELMAN